MATALDIVNRFYEVTGTHKGKGLRELVADDMVFIGPIQETSGAEAYVALNEQFLTFHRETRMFRQFEDGNEVCSIYEMDVQTPSGGMITLSLVDWIRIADGRMAEQRIYYDPRDFAEAFMT